MSPGLRVAAFVALLAAIFACAALAGSALHPDRGASHPGSHDAAPAGTVLQSR